MKKFYLSTLYLKIKICGNIPFFNKQSFLILMFFFILVILSSVAVYDVRNYRIPNYLLSLFLILSMMYLKTLHLKTALIWGIGFIFLKFMLERILKRPALGWGDVKLIMMMGLWMPWDVTPTFLLSIGLLGITLSMIYKIFWQKDVFPFAPALILGFLWSIKNT